MSRQSRAADCWSLVSEHYSLSTIHYPLSTTHYSPRTFLLRPAATVVGFTTGTWRTEVSLAAPPDHLHSLSGLEGRRSTRIDRTVPLVVLGQTKTGLSFQEKT